MQIEKQIQFKNWSDEDFTYSFDNQDFTFKTGKTYVLPVGAANHYAKHLAERELLKSKDERDHAFPLIKYNDYVSRALPNGSVQNAFEEVREEAPKFEEVETEVKEETQPEPQEEAKKTIGRPKKSKDEEYVD